MSQIIDVAAIRGPDLQRAFDAFVVGVPQDGAGNQRVRCLEVPEDGILCGGSFDAHSYVAVADRLSRLDCDRCPSRGFVEFQPRRYDRVVKAEGLECFSRFLLQRAISPVY